jgi:CubicO group peptidase (beta-lactamase class C family)
VVNRAVTPWLFKRASEPSIFYTFKSGRFSIEDYLARNPATGLLIARDDTILVEHYQYARTDSDRFLSQSMAKTITAMLVGIALAENKIKSIDDPVSAYVPGLADTEYGSMPLRTLLHMSSGVSFSENYDGADDIAKLSRDLFGEPGKDPVASVPSSTRASRRPERGGTMPAPKPKSSAWCCAPPSASRSPIICATGSGSRSAPSPTPPGRSIAPGRK